MHCAGVLFVHLPKDERDGWFAFGLVLEEGIGCEKDAVLARAHFLRASELEHAESARRAALLFPSSDARFWTLAGEATLRGDRQSKFLQNFSMEISKYEWGGAKNGKVLFAIGKVLRGHIDDRTILRESFCFSSRCPSAIRAVQFVDKQIDACKAAMKSWCLVGIRLGVVKDVRKLIAELIWRAREEGEYKVQV